MLHTLRVKHKKTRPPPPATTPRLHGASLLCLLASFLLFFSQWECIFVHRSRSSCLLLYSLRSLRILVQLRSGSTNNPLPTYRPLRVDALPLSTVLPCSQVWCYSWDPGWCVHAWPSCEDGQKGRASLSSQLGSSNMNGPQMTPLNLDARCNSLLFGCLFQSCLLARFSFFPIRFSFRFRF